MKQILQSQLEVEFPQAYLAMAVVGFGQPLNSHRITDRTTR